MIVPVRLCGPQLIPGVRHLPERMVAGPRAHYAHLSFHWKPVGEILGSRVCVRRIQLLEATLIPASGLWTIWEDRWCGEAIRLVKRK